MALTQASEGGLKISNAGSNGQFLSKQSGNTGGLTWATPPGGAGGASGLDVNDNVKIRLGTGNDLEIYHDATNSHVHNKTGALYLSSDDALYLYNEWDNEYYVKCAPNAAVELYYNNTLKLTTLSSGVQMANGSGNNTLSIFDDDKISFGNNGDLQLFHNGTNSQIENSQGDLNIKSDVLRFRAANDEQYITAIANGAVELYYDNAKKINTKTDGVLITGEASVSGNLMLNHADNQKIYLGAGDDLQILHDGSASIIKHTNAANDLYIQCDNNIYFTDVGANETFLKLVDDGGVDLYYDNTLRFQIYNNGCFFATELTASDNSKIKLGSGADLEIYHDGSHSRIVDAGTGDLKIQTNSLQLLNAAGDEYHISAVENGAVSLYYDNSKVAETWSGGLRLTGAIKAVNSTADSHWGTDSSTWSQFQTLTANNVAIFENSHDSTPYGNYLYFSDAAPDNNVQYYIQCDDNSASRIKMYADGDIWTSDAGTLTSDETLKENITDATSKLEDLKKLKVRNFYWKASFHPEKSKKKQLGFIAQEVETVFPNLIQEHDVAIGIPGDDHTPLMKKSIKQAWAPILVKALQEAIAKIETLETKVAALEAA